MTYNDSMADPDYSFATETDRFWVNNLVFFVGLGPLAVSTNFLVLYLVIKGKKYKTRFYLFVAAFVLSRMLQSAYIVTYGIFQVVGAKLQILYMGKLYCMLVYVVPYMCECSAIWIICLIAVDRLLAITMPMKYRHFTIKSALLALMGVYVTCTVQVVAGISLELWANNQRHVMCRSITLVIKSSYSYAIMYLNVLSGFISVTLYACILVVAKIKIRRKAVFKIATIQVNGRSSRQKDTITSEVRLASSVCMLILLYSINVVLIPFLRFILSQFYELTVSSDFLVYCTRLTVLDFIFEPIMLLWKSNELRKVLYNCILRWIKPLDKSSIGG